MHRTHRGGIGTRRPGSSLRSALALGVLCGSAAGQTPNVVVMGGNWGGSCVAPCDMRAVPVPNYQFSIVASGDRFAVGIDADGFLHAWGCNPHIPGPTPGGTFSHVGAGEQFYVALRSSPGGFGVPVHVGDTSLGQRTDFPDTGYTFKSISVGEYHAIGIIKEAENGATEDTLYVWGGFPVGQTCPHTQPAHARFNLPAPYNQMPVYQLKFKFVEAGAYNSAGILHYPDDPSVDGRLIVWGNDDLINGRLVSAAPSNPDRRYKFVALGHRHGIAIRAASAAYPGDDGLLEPFTDAGFDPYNHLQAPPGRFKSVMGGYAHSVAISVYNQVHKWSWNGCMADPPPSGNNFASVGLGESSHFTVAITQGGSCYANCDGSTSPPMLSSNDFICFANAFAANDPYADCDGVGGLTANDYQSFANKFANGCGM
ncbi:MAG: hypothetical protein KF678_13535 [Phycisphaeraceae bacterium]|nr:hypothetical protein [Phycisphaeraceae bacterium]